MKKYQHILNICTTGYLMRLSNPWGINDSKHSCKTLHGLKECHDMKLEYRLIFDCLPSVLWDRWSGKEPFQICQSRHSRLSNISNEICDILGMNSQMLKSWNFEKQIYHWYKPCWEGILRQRWFFKTFSNSVKHEMNLFQLHFQKQPSDLSSWFELIN